MNMVGNRQTPDGAPNWRDKPYAERMEKISRFVRFHLKLDNGPVSKLALTPVEQNRRAYEALQDRRLYAKWN
jgi:1,2-phenylacetyl-CoA epoxidase catalytic subunit